MIPRFYFKRADVLLCVHAILCVAYAQVSFGIIVTKLGRRGDCIEVFDVVEFYFCVGDDFSIFSLGGDGGAFVIVGADVLLRENNVSFARVIFFARDEIDRLDDAGLVLFIFGGEVFDEFYYG